MKETHGLMFTLSPENAANTNYVSTILATCKEASLHVDFQDKNSWILIGDQSDFPSHTEVWRVISKLQDMYRFQSIRPITEQVAENTTDEAKIEAVHAKVQLRGKQIDVTLDE